MEKIIKRGKVSISFDIEKLSKEIDDMGWDKPYFVEEIDEILEADPDTDEFPDNGNDYECDSQENFDELKKSFKEGMLKILNKPDSINVDRYLIKSGVFHKTKRKILLESGICSGYSDEYGSHSYDETILEISNAHNDPTKGIVTIRDITQQSSF